MTYRRKMERASDLAHRRATRWHVQVESRSGVRSLYIDAETEEAARRKVEAPNGRRLKRPPVVLRVTPDLGSAAWRAIYQEVGLPA